VLLIFNAVLPFCIPLRRKRKQKEKRKFAILNYSANYLLLDLIKLQKILTAYSAPF